MDDRWLAALEKLAALDLGQQERELLRADLTRIIEFAGSLPESSGRNTAHCTTSPLYNQHKSEDPTGSFSRDSFIAGAPDFCDGFLQSPAVLQQSPEDEDA